MGQTCQHSLCSEPALFVASRSEDGSWWQSGKFCACHADLFTCDEAFADLRRIEPVAREAFNGP